MSRWPHADQIFISCMRHITRRTGLDSNIIAFDFLGPYTSTSSRNEMPIKDRRYV